MIYTALASLVLIFLSATVCGQVAYNGETLISPLDSNDSFLIDLNHNITKTWHGDGAPASVAYLLPDGSLLRPCLDPNAQFGIGGSGGRIQKIDTNDNVVWDYFFSDSVLLQHHDIEPMPNGNVLLIAWERKTEAEATAAGRLTLPIGEMWPTMIAEIEPVGLTGGNIVWEWHFWDHMIQDVDPAKDNHGVIADHPELVDINWPVVPNGSWDHANAISYNAQLDQIAFCARALSEVYIIDHSTTTAEAAGHTGGNSGMGGDILYRWGNPEVYGRGTEADRYFWSVHGATWIDPALPGAGNLLIFNNGNRDGSVNDYSGVAEIVLPSDGYGNYYLRPGQAYGPSAPIWEYEKPPGFYSQNKGGAYRLPNGNTLICEANDDNIFEVTPDGTKVWQYSPPGEVHRAQRYWTTVTAAGESRARLKAAAGNFPNPFNPHTTITFELADPGPVQLQVFDVSGKLVTSLVDGELESGRHDIQWTGVDDADRPVSSGVYFYRVTAPGFSQRGKMVLAK